MLFVRNSGHEGLGGLESGDVVSGDDDGCILADVTTGLLCALLDDEAAEATKVDVLTLG